MRASGSSREVTINVPPGFSSRLMGCSPYHAHDSTPLHSVSSTAMLMSTSLGSYLAIPSSSVWSSVATMAKFFAGTPLRYGDSPERNGVPAKNFALVATDDQTLQEGMAKDEPKEEEIRHAVGCTLCKGVEA